MKTITIKINDIIEQNKINISVENIESNPTSHEIEVGEHLISNIDLLLQYMESKGVKKWKMKSLKTYKIFTTTTTLKLKSNSSK